MGLKEVMLLITELAVLVKSTHYIKFMPIDSRLIKSKVLLKTRKLKGLPILKVVLLKPDIQSQ
ncbi:MAG: hypothetical protein K0R18_2626 [Bacillales bacterium]|jgi:hypothetical protein|nr:hypothetical protein [Bacillales bacterium]